jgi:NADH-quinone oxidoreductase subunit C
VAPLRLLPTAIQLRDKWDFDQVLSVTGIDYPERAELAVVYHIAARFKKNLRHLIVSLETKVPRAEPRVHTLAFVWPSAELHERETHELLGIEFANHPNCGPLLLPEDWEGGYPLRKDFRLRAAEEVER